MKQHLTLELGDLQQKILKHLIECQDNGESVSNVSKELQTLQPAVFRSIKYLIDNGYLTKDKRYRRGEKLVSLTSKGAAAAVMLGTTYKQFENFAKKKNSVSDLRLFLFYIRDPGKQDIIFKKAVEYLLNNNGFDNEGNVNTGKLTGELLLHIATEINTIFDDTRTLKEFVEKYNLDKEALRNKLEERKRNIESLIEQLAESSTNIIWKKGSGEGAKAYELMTALKEREKIENTKRGL